MLKTRLFRQSNQIVMTVVDSTKSTNFSTYVALYGERSDIRLRVSEGEHLNSTKTAAFPVLLLLCGSENKTLCYDNNFS